MVFKLS